MLSCLMLSFVEMPQASHQGGTMKVVPLFLFYTLKRLKVA